VWDRIWSEDLDERKGEVLVKIWKGKEKTKRAKEKKNIEESRRSVGDRNGKDEESKEKIREGRGRSY